MTTEEFLAIGQQLKGTYESGDLIESKRLATHYLESATSFRDNWNYGNAIHHSHIVLGKIALTENVIEDAVNHLILAGKTPGSPQLNSFGPDMSLAKALLEAGEKEYVIQYINLCTSFWFRIWSWRKARRWKKNIENGVVPDFGPNLICFGNSIPIGTQL